LRLVTCSLAVTAVLLGGPARAEDRTRQAKPAAAKEGPLHFDVDRFFQDFDKNKDGSLARDELPEAMRKHFDRIDLNKDGKLSKEELEQGMAHLHPPRRPSDMVYILVEMSDCDECCCDEVQRAYDILRKLDKNGDGKINADELQAMREGLLKERVDMLFKALDQNQDGRISRDEARGHVREDFDRLDANKDGYVDRQELLRAAEKRPEKAAGKGRPAAEQGR